MLDVQFDLLVQKLLTQKLAARPREGLVACEIRLFRFFAELIFVLGSFLFCVGKVDL